MKADMAKRRLICVLLILVSGLPFSPAAVSAPGQSFEEIFNLIYEQQFTQARAALKGSRDSLDKWEYQVLDLDLLFWEALSGDSRDDYDRLESGLGEYSSGPGKNSDADMLEELITLSYSFRLQAIKGRFLSMMVDFLKINHIIQRLEPDMLSPDQQEVFNIYLALYNIGKSKLLLNNAKLREESIHMLENCLNSSNTVYRTAARYFLSKIYLEVDHSPAKARVYCEQLCYAYPTNKIFTYNLELCRKQEASLR